MWSKKKIAIVSTMKMYPSGCLLYTTTKTDNATSRNHQNVQKSIKEEYKLLLGPVRIHQNWLGWSNG